MAETTRSRLHCPTRGSWLSSQTISFPEATWRRSEWIFRMKIHAWKKMASKFDQYGRQKLTQPLSLSRYRYRQIYSIVYNSECTSCLRWWFTKATTRTVDITTISSRTPTLANGSSTMTRLDTDFLKHFVIPLTLMNFIKQLEIEGIMIKIPQFPRNSIGKEKRVWEQKDNM